MGATSARLIAPRMIPPAIISESFLHKKLELVPLSPYRHPLPSPSGGGSSWQSPTWRIRPRKGAAAARADPLTTGRTADGVAAAAPTANVEPARECVCVRLSAAAAAATDSKSDSGTRAKLCLPESGGRYNGGDDDVPCRWRCKRRGGGEGEGSAVAVAWRHLSHTHELRLFHC